MTDAVHPSLDELSDLRAGLLDADRERKLSAHVSTCEQCTDQTTSLAEVETILTAAGSAPMPLPDGASASLYAALERASAERAADVASLADRRRTVALPHEGSGLRLRRWATAAGAAAAVVLLGYGGFSLLHSGGGSTSSASSSSDSGGGERAAAGGAPTMPGAQVPKSLGWGGVLEPALTRKDLPRYAARLAAGGTAAGASGGAGGGVDATCASSGVHVPSRSAAATVHWQGTLALVVVDRGHHRVKVYSCRGAGVLYSTTY